MVALSCLQSRVSGQLHSKEVRMCAESSCLLIRSLSLAPAPTLSHCWPACVQAEYPGCSQCLVLAHLPFWARLKVLDQSAVTVTSLCQINIRGFRGHTSSWNMSWNIVFHLFYAFGISAREWKLLCKWHSSQNAILWTCKLTPHARAVKQRQTNSLCLLHEGELKEWKGRACNKTRCPMVLRNKSSSKAKYFRVSQYF